MDASFLVVGIQLPFWPVWLAGRGLDAQEIAIVFAAAIWAKVVATPLLGALADRLGRRRAVMIGLAAAACAAYAGLWPVWGWWPLLALNLIAGMAQSALMPLGDSITLAAVREEGLDYGRIRVWGSVSFILASVGSGALISVGSGGNQILFLVLAASVVLVLASIGIPPAVRRAGIGRPRWAALGLLAADRRFWLFVVSAAALQSSHQLYYGFGTLYWRGLGFSDTVIGALWAEGVVAEIVLFWWSAPLLARFGPHLQLNLARVGELDRVAQQVQNDLPQAARIDRDHSGNFRIDVHQQLELFLMGAHSHRPDHRFDQGAHFHLLRLERKLARFDLGEIQNVVDQSQQRAGGAFDGGEIFRLLPVELGLQRELGHADDRVHGSPDFMAHVGQKFAFQPPGSFGLLLRQR